MKKYKILLRGIKIGHVWLLLLLMAVSAVVALCPPLIAKLILDRGIMLRDSGTVIILGICLVATYIASFIINYAISQSLTRASTYFISDIKNMLFSHIMKLPMEFFDERQTGYINERIKEVDSLNVFFSPVFLRFLTSMFSLAGAAVIVASMRWELLAIIAICLPAIYFLGSFSGTRLKHASSALLESTARMAGNVQENIGGISAIKELKLEDERASAISQQLKNLAERTVRRGRIMNATSEGMQGLVNISTAVLVVFAAMFIIDGKMTIGDYWSVSQYATLIFAPVQLFASIRVLVQPGMAAMSRLSKLLDVKTEDTVEGSIDIGNVSEIDFSDVSFAYGDGGNMVISNFSMHIQNGDKVAILGKNGSGKTTLAKLMLGFYKNYNGHIRINGAELKDISISALRSRVGIVAQNVFLFSGTLMDNIRHASPGMTEGEVASILENVGLDISDFPEGLNTILSENGKALSGGQRQKLAIARLMVKAPDVMIFDEATSNLDTASREFLKSTIITAFTDKTCIIITHDADVAAIADRIVRLSE